jgi:2Fe-2S ferredoxin
MIGITFVLRDGSEKAVEAETGQTLMNVAKINEIDIEAACGGALACSTCHVIVDSVWYGKLPAPLIDETDMLDLASSLTRMSRLACQINLTEAMDGLKVALPK